MLLISFGFAFYCADDSSTSTDENQTSAIENTKSQSENPILASKSFDKNLGGSLEINSGSLSGTKVTVPPGSLAEDGVVEVKSTTFPLVENEVIKPVVPPFSVSSSVSLNGSLKISIPLNEESNKASLVKGDEDQKQYHVLFTPVDDPNIEFVTILPYDLLNFRYSMIEFDIQSWSIILVVYAKLSDLYKEINNLEAEEFKFLIKTLSFPGFRTKKTISYNNKGEAKATHIRSWNNDIDLGAIQITPLGYRLTLLQRTILEYLSKEFRGQTPVTVERSDNNNYISHLSYRDQNNHDHLFNFEYPDLADENPSTQIEHLIRSDSTLVEKQVHTETVAMNQLVHETYKECGGDMALQSINTINYNTFGHPYLTTTKSDFSEKTCTLTKKVTENPHSNKSTEILKTNVYGQPLIVEIKNDSPKGNECSKQQIHFVYDDQTRISEMETLCITEEDELLPIETTLYYYY